MGSRIRQNPIRIFECWCEVVAPEEDNRRPFILQTYPDTFKQEKLLIEVPKFTFPCYFERKVAQHFCFVFTDDDSKYTFGFCRHTPESNTAQVILSFLPWHELFYKLMNHCDELVTSGKEQKFWSCLKSVYEAPVPSPETELLVRYSNEQIFIASCPNHNSLHSIPEDRNLSELYGAIDYENMMVLFASLLHERSVIMKSRILSKLSSCVHAANTIISPMHWQYAFIPILPLECKEVLASPIPTLIGVHSSTLEGENPKEINRAVIIDVDNNRITSPYRDLEALPTEVKNLLSKNLKDACDKLGDSIARSFAVAVMQLLNNYTDAFQIDSSTKKIKFNEKRYIDSNETFGKQMTELQMFRQFIGYKENLLNSGKQFDEIDLFMCSVMESSRAKELLQTHQNSSGLFKTKEKCKKVRRSDILNAVNIKVISPEKDVQTQNEKVVKPSVLVEDATNSICTRYELNIQAQHKAKLQGESWYFSNMNREKAEEKLRVPENEDGTFLIRDSQNKCFHIYTLSVLHSDTVKHFKIKQINQNGLFIVAESYFKTLQELVAHYSKDADGLPINLRKPCMLGDNPASSDMPPRT